MALAAIGFSLSRLEAVRPLEWLTVPAVFLFGNVVEFLGHRGPMHHRQRGLRLLFQRHTEQHHRFFTHEALAYESARDVKMVLFPPVLLLFFLGAIATPLAALCFALVSPSVGWLFAASAVGYYLITFPLLDWFFGTAWRPGDSERGGACRGLPSSTGTGALTRLARLLSRKRAGDFRAGSAGRGWGVYTHEGVHKSLHAKASHVPPIKRI